MAASSCSRARQAPAGLEVGRRRRCRGERGLQVVGQRVHDGRAELAAFPSRLTAGRGLLAARPLEPNRGKIRDRLQHGVFEMVALQRQSANRCTAKRDRCDDESAGAA